MTDDAGVFERVNFEHLFSKMTSPLALLGEAPDFEFVAVNDAYCNITGRTRASLLGAGLFDAFPGNETLGGEQALRASFREALKQNTAQVMPLQRYDIDDGAGMTRRYWSITNTPIVDPGTGRRFVLIHPEEVTSFVQPRLAREASGTNPSSAAETRAVNTVFTATIDRLQHLNDLTAALVGATTADEVARALLRDALGLAAATSGSVVSDDGDRFVMLAETGIALDTTDTWQTFPFAPGSEPFSDAIVAREPLFFASRHELLSSYPSLEEFLGDDHCAWAVLPFRDGERTLGALGLIYTEPTNFGSTQRLLLYTITSLASQAMSRARLISEQTTTIESIDRALLDMRIDDIDGLDVTDLYDPSSQAVTAGGDWYDIIELSATRTLIVIGDIASHGPVAVGDMAHARAVVRAMALGGHRSDQIASQASTAIEHFSNTHATATIAIYDHTTRLLTWTSAGHPPSVLVPHDSSAPVELLDAPHGTPLGVAATYRYSQRHIEPGDRLVLYTDGLIEQPSVHLNDAFARLTRLIDTGRQSITVHDILDHFHPRQRHADDIAILSIVFGNGARVR